MGRFPAAVGCTSDCFPSGALWQGLNCCYSRVRSLRILVQRIVRPVIWLNARTHPRRRRLRFSLFLRWPFRPHCGRATLFGWRIVFGRRCRERNPRGTLHLPDCFPLCRPSGTSSPCARLQEASSLENCLHRNSHALVAASPRSAHWMWNGFPVPALSVVRSISSRLWMGEQGLRDL